MRLTTTACLALLWACGAAQADGLAELKSALGRLQGQGMVRGTLEARTMRRLGEGKEQDEQVGLATVGVEDGAGGLRLQYGREVLARLDSEANAQASNPNAKTPTSNALRDVEPGEVRHMLGAAASLARALEKASYQGEKSVTLDGRAARQLSFTVPIDTLSERQRKYIKTFQGSLDVWIGADGVPLASQRQVTASGRAFLVVGFDLNDEQRNTYAIAGDRLVAIRSDNNTRQSGAGERTLDRNSKTLRLD
jgi:hypothetical protein